MSVKHMPKGYHTVTSLLSVRGAMKLLEFLKEAFGAVELSRFDAADGSLMHAALKIGDSIVMLGEAVEDDPTMPASLYLYVKNADETYLAAINAGGESMGEPAEMFWGDRVGSVRDFAGNKWWIATHVEDVDPEELARRVEEMAV